MRTAIGFTIFMLGVFIILTGGVVGVMSVESDNLPFWGGFFLSAGSGLVGAAVSLWGFKFGIVGGSKNGSF